MSLHRLQSILLILLLAAGGARAQSILTVAGGASDDGRPAALVTLTPRDAAFDSDGNLYVADAYSNRIRRVSAKSGVITTVAGNGGYAHASSGTPGDYSGDGGPALEASLNNPQGVAFDSAGNLYIADTLNHRVRKVTASMGIITTVAGTGVRGFSGDGGPALQAKLKYPSHVAIDPAGNLLIVDRDNGRIRKVDRATGIISTIAGGGATLGDGNLATAAQLGFPEQVTWDGFGNLYIADASNHRVRRVDKTTGIISTAAGSDVAVDPGDGVPATAASLSHPTGIAFDRAGNLYIADNYARVIRKVSAGSGIISTVTDAISDPNVLLFNPAGDLYVVGSQRIRSLPAAGGDPVLIAGKILPFNFAEGDGGPAKSAAIYLPQAIAVDKSENLYIAEPDNDRVRKVTAATGVITTVAGDGNHLFWGDGGPATAASLATPSGLAVDAAGNLYIADSESNRIRRVSAADGTILTVVGSGLTIDGGYAGDGGPATKAKLWGPMGVTIDGSGNMFIADTVNNRVRKVDAATGIITTVAGNGDDGVSLDTVDGVPATSTGVSAVATAVDGAGNLYISDGFSRVRKVDAVTGIITTIAGSDTAESSNDGGPATSAALNYPQAVAVDAAGNVYVADADNARIRKISAATGIISTVAGNGTSGFSGDGGAATASALATPSGIALDAAGNLYVTDTKNNRVREVPVCIALAAPKLTQPADGSSGERTSPKLAWAAVKGAFQYDVYLDTANPPRTLVASDIGTPTYSPANLEPLTKYYWRVVAKGDPFCTPFSTAQSDVFAFTTSGTCGPSGPFAGIAVAGSSTVALSWQPSARAGSYDLYLGASDPPPLYASNMAETSYNASGLATGTTYYWSVIAHAQCDGSRIVQSETASFTTSGSCAGAGAFALSSPADGDTSAPSTVTLSWSAASGAGGYDVYLGTGSNPPLYARDMQQTSIVVSRLSPGADYVWRVVARAACNPARSTSSLTRRFTVAACGTPSVPTDVKGPATAVPVGGTYVIHWSDAAGLGDGGIYIVERASDPGFANPVDAQKTTMTSASFITRNGGTYYHRVRAVPACDVARASANSAAVAVTASQSAPVVVFTLLPQAVMTRLGEKIELRMTTFALENLSDSTVQVLVGPQLTGSVPFFTIVDPFGGDGSFVTLEPRKPKTLEIQFSGPPNDRTASYQGGVYVTAVGQPLAFTPQAYVALKIGGDAKAAAPRLLFGGVDSELAVFPAASGDDAGRPAIDVDLYNGGTVGMDVAAEIGPEAWLKLEKDWNASPVPVSAFRTLHLSTQRTKAVAGSALPRYTYLTVRSLAAEPARMLIEDSSVVPGGAGREAPLAPGQSSRVIGGVDRGTVLLLTNSGNDAAVIELIYTPAGADGFDNDKVLHASLVVPPNDVVGLTDPLRQLFNIAEGDGSIEIRGTDAALGQLAIRAESRTAVHPLPVAMRGEGARVASPHRISGVISDADMKTSLVLWETSGREATSAHIVLSDSSGNVRGDKTLDLGRYGMQRIDDVAQTLAGGAAMTGGRLDIDIPAGGGAVMGMALITDRKSGAGGVIVSCAITKEVHLAALAASTPYDYVIPGIVNTSALKTTIGMSAGSAANVKISPSDTIAIPAGQTVEYSPPAGIRTLSLESDAPLSVYARVRGTGVVDMLPVVNEALSGGGSSTPLYADGLEQSIDADRGRTTSLTITEIAGRAAAVNVRLYEPGNRSEPIALKDFVIGPSAVLELGDLFGALGLASGAEDLEQRRKNRVNVAVVVTASGDGLVAAQAVMTDNRTGNRQTIPLQPAGGVPLTSAPRGTAAPTAPPPVRRRIVKR